MANFYNANMASSMLSLLAFAGYAHTCSFERDALEVFKNSDGAEVSLSLSGPCPHHPDTTMLWVAAWDPEHEEEDDREIIALARDWAARPCVRFCARMAQPGAIDKFGRDADLVDIPDLAYYGKDRLIIYQAGKAGLFYGEYRVQTRLPYIPEMRVYASARSADGVRADLCGQVQNLHSAGILPVEAVLPLMGVNPPVFRTSFLIEEDDEEGYHWPQWDRAYPSRDFVAKSDESMKGFDAHTYLRWLPEGAPGYQRIKLNCAAIPYLLSYWQQEAERDAALREQRFCQAQRLAAWRRRHTADWPTPVPSWSSRRYAEMYQMAGTM